VLCPLIRQELDFDTPGDAASECDPGPVNLDQQRPVERSAGSESEDIPGMDPVVIQAATETMPALEFDDACPVSWCKLIESHGENDKDYHSQYKGWVEVRRRYGLADSRPLLVSCQLRMTGDRLDDLFLRLVRAYGPQGWWPGGDDPLEVLVGAVLTQRCAWRNAEKALEGLKAEGLLSIAALAERREEVIQRAVRPAGFYRSKTRTLKAVAGHVVDLHGGNLSKLLGRSIDAVREDLLAIRGIGEETADAICLYAAGLPSFVIDAYARRLLERLGWISGAESYDELRAAFMERLPPDAPLFNEYHALIVRHGKERCRSQPRCEACPLEDLCGVPSNRPGSVTT